MYVCFWDVSGRQLQPALESGGTHRPPVFLLSMNHTACGSKADKELKFYRSGLSNFVTAADSRVRRFLTAEEDR